MGKQKKYAYCNSCNKPIKKPKKKSMEGFQLTIWSIIILSTLGLALIPFIIYRKLIVKRKFCPECGEIVVFYDTPQQFPGPAPALLNVLDKIEAEKKEKEKEKEVAKVKEVAKEKQQIEEKSKAEKREKVHCPFCHKTIDMGVTICPYCGVSLKE